MRFIIHELEYEKPVAAGRLRYQQDGEPTGAVEAWRLTAAVDGYQFLRVDLDARDAASGRSYLFHMVLNPEGQPEQLKYRVFDTGLLVSGAIVWEPSDLAGTRTVNDETFQEVVDRGAFWFPSALGLWTLPAQLESDLSLDAQPGATLQSQADDVNETFRLYATPVRITWRPGSNDPGRLTESYLRVSWDSEVRELWLDSEGYPVRLKRPDGLESVTTQLVVYNS